MTLLAPMLASAGPIAAGWTAHAAMMARQLRESRRDPVTGLPTRVAWTRQANKIMQNGCGAIILLDLDKFKEANDTYGHAAGDAVLTATALRLRAWTDQVGGGASGRLGGDEFAVITRKVPGEAELDELARQLAAPVALPDGRTVAVAASIGVAAESFAALPAALGAADAGMYLAKRFGGGWRRAAAATDPNTAPEKRVRHHGPRTSRKGVTANDRT